VTDRDRNAGGANDTSLHVVAIALSEPEAELIRQRLAQAGIAALTRRVIGGAEWGDSGSRYVYVRAPDLERAHKVLDDSG
jgi:hypothetical protein